MTALKTAEGEGADGCNGEGEGADGPLHGAWRREFNLQRPIRDEALAREHMIALLEAHKRRHDDAIAEAYLSAAKGVGESMWRMPLLEELREALKSDIADLKHTGDRYGGSISAALFLREFVGDTKWVHLDIAGPAFLDRVTALGPKGGTGYGVMSFVAYLDQLAE